MKEQNRRDSQPESDDEFGIEDFDAGEKAEYPYESVLDDADREIFTEAIATESSAKGLEALSSFIVSLLMRISQEPHGAQNVRNELQLTLESLFKRSRAFKAAFELYTLRYCLGGGSIKFESAGLAEMLEQIKAEKVDVEDPEVLLGFDKAKGIFPPATPQRPDWMSRLGATIASMYDDESLSESTLTELSDCVLEISNSVRLQDVDSFEARLMLPHYLRAVYDSDDDVKLVIRYGTKVPQKGIAKRGAMQTLCTVQAPDICEAFKKIVKDFDRIFAQTEEEAKATEAAENSYVVNVCIHRSSGRFTTIQQCLIPFEWFSRLEDYMQQHAPVAPEQKAEPKPDPAPVIYHIADYRKLDLAFRTTKTGNRLLEFQIVRGHRDSDEFYFNTYKAGINSLTLNQDGYKFPMHDNAKDLEENIILEQGRNLISFLGLDDIEAFKLDAVVQGEKISGLFQINNDKGETVQALTLWR